MDYIGDAYAGWQKQPDKVTVQGTLEHALYLLTGETCNVAGSGRTDAGVHALQQTAHFDLQSEWRSERLKGGLNHFLPRDVRVQDVCAAAADFHARYDCKRKTYEYVMYRGDKRAVYANRAWAVRQDTDVAAMRRACAAMVGEKDFAAFMAGGSDVKTTVRTVYRADVAENDGVIVFTVTANGFLYNMVRIMVTVLEAAGRGVFQPQDVERLLKDGDRNKIKGLAPPYGLYLKSQEY